MLETLAANARLGRLFEFVKEVAKQKANALLTEYGGTLLRRADVPDSFLRGCK